MLLLIIICPSLLPTQHWPFPRGHLGLGYAYILTHPGIPCLLHEHLMEAPLRKIIADLVGSQWVVVWCGVSGWSAVEHRGGMLLECLGRWGVSGTPWAGSCGCPALVGGWHLLHAAERCPSASTWRPLQVSLRQRAGIQADSKLEILAAEHDMYVARINGNVTVKLGPRYDMGSLVPRKEEGWALVVTGNDFAVWEKQ